MEEVRKHWNSSYVERPNVTLGLSCCDANFVYFYFFFFHHFHIDHNASCLPPKILRNHCFQFLLGIIVVPREIEDNGYAKFWGVNKVHYGLCENSEFTRGFLFLFQMDSGFSPVVLTTSWEYWTFIRELKFITRMSEKKSGHLNKPLWKIRLYSLFRLPNFSWDFFWTYYPRLNHLKLSTPLKTKILIEARPKLFQSWISGEKEISNTRKLKIPSSGWESNSRPSELWFGRANCWAAGGSVASWMGIWLYRKSSIKSTLPNKPFPLTAPPPAPVSYNLLVLELFHFVS